MSLSSSGNQGYLDITNAILRVGTLDVYGITGVDMVTNVVKQNAVLVWDDQGADMSTPPFQLGAGVARSTSPPEINLRDASGSNFMYHGLKLPNQWMAQFDLYLDTGTTGNVHLQMYTSSTTTYGDDGYQFIFDAANSTLTLEYDGTQVQQSAVTYTTGWQTFVVSFNRGAWGVARQNSVVFTLDDVERSAVYDNTSGQYLRFETNATTARKVRYLKFTNSGPWLQSNTGSISFLTGNVSVGHHTTSHKLSVAGSANVGALTATSVNLSGGVDSTSVSTGDLTLKGLGVLSNIHTSNLFTSNNVGIGTVTPEAPLSVIGNSALSGNPNNAIASFRATTAIPGTNDAGVVIGSVNGNAPYIADVSSASLGLDFYTQNNRRMKIKSDGNVAIGTHDPQYTLDVAGTANVGAITMNSNVYAKGLHLAEVASNLVTWNSTTGDLMDSGGLISNKLAIVSEQPPAALTGLSTVVDGHGKYIVASSTGTAYNAFDKSSTAWTSGTTYNGSTGAYTGAVDLGGAQTVSGEYVTIEFPYKTTLRHVTILPGGTTASFPGTAYIYGTNDNGTTWTALKNWSGVTPSLTSAVQTFTVNAPTTYKKYALVVNATSAGSTTAQVGELRLFTETFTVDAGVVSTTAASGLDVGYTEHPVEPMTDFMTYIEGHGTYEASASTYSSDLYPWEAFDNNTGTRWAIGAYNGYNQTTGEWDQTAINNYPHIYTDDVGGTRFGGHWLQIKLPYAITLSHSNVHPTNTLLERAPKDGVILGSNDGEHWYKLTQFTGKTYTDSTWTRIDVNATTPYQYFRLCTTKVGTGTYQYGYVELTEWRLFAEKPVTRMENVHISGELSSETLQTGYIKWPKVPLKASAESEGYVVSASSGSYSSFRLFNDILIGLNTEYWSTNATYNTSTGAHNSTVSTADVGGTVHYGEWVQIQLPQKIALSFFKVYPRAYGTGTFVLDRSPNSGSVLGSDDGVNWYLVNKFSGVTYTLESTKSGEKIDVQSSKSYEYYRFVFTTVQASPGTAGDRIDMMELQLFEAATGVGAAPTSAKLQVAGSLGMAKGSEFFAGDDVVMELPRHDRPLVKYPEVKMTANSSGGYVASASSYYDPGSYPPYEAFNGVYGTELDMWISRLYAYKTSDGTADTSNCATFNGIYGEYLQLSMPKKIKLQKIRVHSRNNNVVPNAPHKGRIYGSNDNSTWTQIGTYDGLNMVHNDYRTIIVNAYEYYKHYTFQVEEISPFINYYGYVNIAELEYYGTEEGDTSVDVVHRSIPNKPSPQHLEVYWDANDSNSYSFANSSNVYDLSGNGVKGTITGTNGFDSTYNAWVFDGSGDYISTTSSGLGTGGAFDHSFAFWFKINRKITNNDYVVTFGEETNDNMIAVNISGNNLIHFDNWGRGVITGSVVTFGQWHHVVCTHTGSATGNIDNQLIYLNGIRQVTGVTGTGTLAFTSNRITIGARPGTNNSNTPAAFLDGAVADVRFYKGKVLNADQVRELYEYDAPRFGHRHNLVALHKGNLGVGVAHPTSRFEVAGTETLQEYPPKAMTGFETYMEGHGVFRASASTDAYAHTGFATWKAFNKYQGNEGWHSGEGYTYGGSTSPLSYITNTGGAVFDTANVYQQIGGINGQWIKLECPQRIVLKSIVLQNRTLSTIQAPKDFTILGSNNNGDWEIIQSYTGVSSSTSGVTHIVNAEESYKYFVLVVTRVQTTDTADAVIGEWRLFGTPAPSSLEDGHLTLGKALTLPRVSGHPAGAETPRAESLVVHYDTTVESVVSGTTVVDISGNGLNGTLTNGAAYSSTDRAFTFDGTDDKITTTAPFSAGDNTFSASFWLKRNANGTTYCPLYIGDASNTEGIGMDIYGSGDVYWFIYFGKNFLWNGVTQTWFPVGSWTHVAISHKAGTDFANLNKVWINGVEMSSSATFSGSDNLSLDANDSVTLGARVNTNYLNGQISNFKFRNVALTAEEVAMEYALGRTGKSINLTDTALCLGGTVPRAQLDVRGGAVFNGEPVGPSTRPAFLISSNGTLNRAFGSSRTDSYKTKYASPLPIFDDAELKYNINNCLSFGDYAGRKYIKFTAPANGIYNFGLAIGLFTNSHSSSDYIAFGIHIDKEGAYDTNYSGGGAYTNLEYFFNEIHDSMYDTGIYRTMNGTINVKLNKDQFVVFYTRSVENTKIEQGYSAWGHIVHYL